MCRGRPSAPRPTRPQRGARRVERDVPATHDDDPLTQVDVEPLVHVEQVLDGTQHAVEVVAREVEVAGASGADGEEDRVVTLEQLREGGVAPDREPGVRRDPELEDRGDLPFDQARGRRYSGIPSTIIPPNRSAASYTLTS